MSNCEYVVKGCDEVQGETVFFLNLASSLCLCVRCVDQEERIQQCVQVFCTFHILAAMMANMMLLLQLVLRVLLPLFDNDDDVGDDSADDAVDDAAVVDNADNTSRGDKKRASCCLFAYEWQQSAALKLKSKDSLVQLCKLESNWSFRRAAYGNS